MALHDAVLVLIDVQKAFDDPKWGERNNPQAEDNIAHLLNEWRMQKRPVIHFRHISQKPTSLFYFNSETSAIKDEVAPLPDEPVMTKHVNSCFIGTNFEAWLRENGYRELVIAGLTTAHCVSTTTRMAENLGFTPYLVADATAAFATEFRGKHYTAEEVHQATLATLHGEFATVLATAELLASLQPIT